MERKRRLRKLMVKMHKLKKKTKRKTKIKALIKELTKPLKRAKNPTSPNLMAPLRTRRVRKRTPLTLNLQIKRLPQRKTAKMRQLRTRKRLQRVPILSKRILPLLLKRQKLTLLTKQLMLLKHWEMQKTKMIPLWDHHLDTLSNLRSARVPQMNSKAQDPCLSITLKALQIFSPWMLF